MLRSLIAFPFARKRLACVATVAASALVAGGCETKSFLDPGQVGRFKADPVTVPILDSLNLGTDESDAQFINAREVRAEDLVESKDDYALGPNDTVSVTISDLVGPGTESTKTVRVSNSGTVTLPQLPRPVQATGLSEQQLEKAISDAYKDAGLIQNPNVSATVVEARGRTYNISGAIGAPGPYAIFDADFRLLNAIVTAKDVTSLVGIDYVYVSRKKTAAAGSTTTAPATQPAGGGMDPLAPRSDAGTATARRSAMLQTAPADSGVPAGSIVVIDGKEVPLNTPPAGSAASMGSSPGMAGTPSTPMDPNMAPARTAGIQSGEIRTADNMAGMRKDFAFNAPAEPGDREVIKVPYAKLKAGEMKYNIIVRPNDFIFVKPPDVGTYYIGGNVLAPGAYSLSPTKITLKEAVISARGLNEVAWPSRTEVVRRLPGDKEIFVRVDLDKIFAGQEPDLYLKPDDQVNIGTNALAPFLGAIRNGFRFTYGFGFLYDRNFNTQNNNNN